MITRQAVQISEAPAIDGLWFRHYEGEQDLPAMLEVISSAKVADGIERSDTLENIRNTYAHLTNCDPYQDVLIAMVNDEMVAYSRVSWSDERSSGAMLYESFGFVKPEWRRKGLGTAMLHANQQRLRQIAASHAPAERFFSSFAHEGEKEHRALLEKDGYSVVRMFYQMVRPNLENIPNLPLPAGLEVRPAKPEHYRAIWEAWMDAFSEHWGFSTPTEEEYEEWLGHSNFQPERWQVAWDGNEVAGMVLAFIDETQNREYHRLRGWTEDIGVRKAWRKRGLASALIVRSLRDQKALGMTESALGVDTENKTGALRLYERLGFRPVTKEWSFRKRME